MNRVCSDQQLANQYVEEDLADSLRVSTPTTGTVALTVTAHARHAGQSIGLVFRQCPGGLTGDVLIAVAHKSGYKDLALLPLVIQTARNTDKVNRLSISPMQDRDYLIPYYVNKLGFTQYEEATPTTQPLYKLNVALTDVSETKVNRWRAMPLRAVGTTGDRQGMGYRYKEDVGLGEAPIALEETMWMPDTWAGQKHIQRGLYATVGIPRIIPGCRNRRPITQYAGHLVHRDDITDLHPAQVAYYANPHTGAGHIIDGFRDPQPGYGMAQFVNDPVTSEPAETEADTEVVGPGLFRDKSKINCELTLFRGTLVLLPLRDLEAGEELFASYGNTYWHRVLDAEPDELVRPYTAPRDSRTKRARQGRAGAQPSREQLPMINDQWENGRANVHAPWDQANNLPDTSNQGSASLTDRPEADQPAEPQPKRKRPILEILPISEAEAMEANRLAYVEIQKSSFLTHKRARTQLPAAESQGPLPPCTDSKQADDQYINDMITECFKELDRQQSSAAQGPHEDININYDEEIAFQNDLIAELEAELATQAPMAESGPSPVPPNRIADTARPSPTPLAPQTSEPRPVERSGEPSPHADDDQREPKRRRPARRQRAPATPPPGARWAGDTHTEPNIQQATDNAEAYALGWENSWGLESPALRNSWQTVEEQTALWQEAQEAWPAEASLVQLMDISPLHHVLRLINILTEGTEIRYITPYSTWAHTLEHDGSGAVQIDPEPTPLPRLPALAAELHLASIAGEQVELRLRLQYQLSSAAGIQGYHPFRLQAAKSYRSRDTNVTERYWATATNNGSTVCPGCMTGGGAEGSPSCDSEITMHTTRWFPHLHIKCARSGKTKTMRLPTDMADYMYGNPKQWHETEKTVHMKPPEAEPTEDTLTTPHPDCLEAVDNGEFRESFKECFKDAHQTHIKADSTPCNFTVISYNTDDCANHSAAEILSYATEVSADAILLQDTRSLPWSSRALLDAGWTLYEHERCAILLNVDTAEHMISTVRTGGKKDPVVWRSEKYNSMAITLDTAKGSIVLVCAYLPPGVDTLSLDPTAVKTAAILSQHSEIDKLVRAHEYGLVGMDANETTYRRGRAQLRGGTHYAFSGTSRGDGLNKSMMRVYADHMVDSHEHYTKGSLPRPTQYPRPEDMSFRALNTNANSSVQSKIDYILTSKKLVPRIDHCAIDTRTQQWTQKGKPRKSYHSALMITLNWEDLWLTSTPKTDRPEVQGAKLRPTPNYAALTPQRAQAISRRVHMRLQRRWNRLRACWKGNRPKHVIRDTLLNDFKSEILKAAKSILGVQRPRRDTRSAGPRVEIDELWKLLVQLVGKALNATVDSMAEGGRIALDGPEIEAIRSALAEKDIMLPLTKPEWTRWWHRRDHHHAEAVINREDLVLTDKLAAEQPRLFYKQVTKPFSAAQIQVLRTKNGVAHTDEAIEAELHDYVQKLAETSPNNDRATIELPARRTPKPMALGLMAKIQMDELILYIQSLDSTSSAGFDGISPALLKTVLLTPWKAEEPKTKEDRDREGLVMSLSEWCVGHREELRYKQGPLPLRPGPETKSTTTVTYEPIRAQQLLLRILNLCIETKDIPKVEKLGIITALPKTEGLVNNTDNIRPITVGPAINRLLHKILAGRLSAQLVRHNLIDRAQSAFIPGGDIHEPISAAVACYRDRQIHNKGCYAIYYDLSKAYDTIQWSSIKDSLRAIGIEETFIEMVMNSLRGTTTAMRTNRPGHITRTVELHKSIKQGCPLAPLLFVIVMDELHKALRSIRQGYVLNSNDMITSRGYCDDTYIVAETMDGLRKMNKIVHAVFAKHGLRVNEIKTKITGRHADGTPLTETISWPGTGRHFELIPPEKPVRYLGALITLDLDWTPQVNHMQGQVMQVISQLKSKRLTLYQGIAITRFVTGPKMDIGMRHATIPSTKLQDWDRWTASALAANAELSACSIPTMGMLLPANIVPMEDQYLMTKITYAMELVTRKAQLRKHHRNLLHPVLTSIQGIMHDSVDTGPPTKKILRPIAQKSRWKGMADALSAAAERGLWIQNNQARSKSAQREKVSASAVGSGDYPTLTFRGVRIPTRDTHDLWGADFDKLKAIGPLLAQPKPPAELADLGQLQCTHTQKTYHHPECPNPPTGPRATISPLGIALTSSAAMARAKCQHCATKWESLDRRLNGHVRAMVCTDGSTMPLDERDRHNKTEPRSAAAFTFMEDGARTKELWGNSAYGWQILAHDNYMAELAAIHKAIRSVPINVAITIHTDSSSAVDSILSTMRDPERTNYLRKGGRPYIMSICRAWTQKLAKGAQVQLLHVRAHTGGRSTASIGNAIADRWAKYYAMAKPQGRDSLSCLDLMVADLPYVLWTRAKTAETTSPTDKGLTRDKAVHGDVRKATRFHLQHLREKEWADRPKRGEIVRCHPSLVKDASKRIRKIAPGTRGMTMLINCLNQVTLRAVDVTGRFAHQQCHRCGTGAPLTVEHRFHACPCNTAALNEMDDKIATHTGFVADADLPGPAPSALTEISTKWHTEITKALRAPARSPDPGTRTSNPKPKMKQPRATRTNPHTILEHKEGERHDAEAAVAPPHPTNQNPRTKSYLSKLVECIKHAQLKHSTLEEVPERTRNALEAHAARCHVQIKPWGSRQPNPSRTRRQVAKLVECLRHARETYTSLEDMPRETRNRLTAHAKRCGLAIRPWTPPTSECPQQTDQLQTQQYHGPTMGGRTLVLPKESPDVREVRIGTVGALEQYSLLYTLESCTKKHGRDRTRPLGEPPRQTMVPILSHLAFLATDMGTWTPRTQAPSLRMACRVVMRTYSDLYLNPLTAAAPWEAVWRSRHQEGWRVGGVETETPEAFMRNRYTWVSMRQGPSAQAEDLAAAESAMCKSEGPARVVLLIQDTPATRDWISKTTKDINKYYIATLNTNTAPALHLDDHNIPAEGSSRRMMSPTSKMALAVIETKQSPPFTAEHMRTATSGTPGILIHEPPPRNAPLPPDAMRNPDSSALAHRAHPLLRRSQTWYHATYKIQPDDTGRQRTDGIHISKGDALPSALALLGELPKGIKGHISDHNERATTRDTLEKVSAIIIDCTLSTLKKDEAFRKWKRKK